MTRDVGIKNINIDLIFGIPGQTLDMLDADLERRACVTAANTSATTA